MCIRVDTLEDMPEDLVDKIEQIRPDLLATNYIDEIAHRQSVMEVMHEFNEYCIAKGVVGFHYTRSFRDSIKKNGLQPRLGQARRDQFLSEFGHLFSATEVAQIKRAYSEYFTKGMNSSRDNMIWFNLSLTALENGGAGPLLEHYGGEVVYMPLKNLGSISDKIRQIGEPLIVTCRLNPDRITGFWNYPVALVWLSAYHTTINPDAYFYDQDIYSTGAIPPEDILSIEIARTWKEQNAPGSNKRQNHMGYKTPCLNR